MPRKSRTLSSTGIYHIVLRSVNKQIIFEEESDYKKFLYILSDYKKNYDIEIYAYCLMDNHIHILLNSAPDKLSLFFLSLETKFVKWYNNKYRRSGHLFQDRFHSIVIEDNDAFLSVLFYIHNNPVKANICKFQTDYRWSSANAYYGQENPIVNTSFAYEIVGIKESLFRYFATQNDSAGDRFFENDHKERLFYLTDEKALEVYHAVTGLPSTSAADNLPRTLRNNFIRKLRRKGVSSKQVSRLMGVSESTVKRISRSAK